MQIAPQTTASAQLGHRCRFCGGTLTPVVDLGMSPPCESFLTADQLHAPETFYPLDVQVCGQCQLMQLPDYVHPADIFSDYAYFSSYSDTYVDHARAYADRMVQRLRLSQRHLVVELASNDGYLLQHFRQHGVPVLGIEPAANVARAAGERGVPTLVRFFDSTLAQDLAAAGKQADLIVANNVLAQVPGLNDFVAGIALLLAPGGTVTVEVPHLMRLIEDRLYDTIYHEHFSYFSLLTAQRLFAAHGLRLFDVEETWTHGGSLRLFFCHADDDRPTFAAVGRLAAVEREKGYDGLAVFEGFAEAVKAAKRELLAFLIRAKDEGKSVVGYGAPGKANTLLNYCGVRTDFIDYLVDRNPYKHGRFTPGTHIPVLPPEHLATTRPDYVLILPWNLKTEIMAQLAYVRGWGGRFVLPVPTVTVL